MTCARRPSGRVIGVHEEFFFKSNTAAADFNKRINRNGCHLPYPSASRTPPCLSASLWTFVQFVPTACGVVRSESESGQMHRFLKFLFNNVAKEQVRAQLITICLPYLPHQKCVGQWTSTSPVFRTVNFVPCCKTALRSCSFQCRPLANVISFSSKCTAKNPLTVSSERIHFDSFQPTRAGAAQRAGKIRCSKAHFEKGRRRAPDALLVG